jgi:hypothetical protein
MSKNMNRLLAQVFDAIGTALVRDEKDKALSLANMGAVLIRRSDALVVTADDLQSIVDAHHAAYPVQSDEVDFTDLKKLLE